MAKRSILRRPKPKARAASRPTTDAAAQGIRYIESSALLAALLEHDAAALSALRGNGRYVTSVLTLAEARRAIVRAQVVGRLTAAQARDAARALGTFERRSFLVDVNDVILARVGRPFPVEPIRTLDAAHLSTAEFLDEPPHRVTIVTRDKRVRDNAEALGYRAE